MKYKLAYLLNCFIILLTLAEAKNRYNLTYAQLDTCDEFDIFDGGYIYKKFLLVHTLDNNKIESNERLHLRFYVTTQKDAHILLSVTDHPRLTDRVYEIVIGAGDNTFSTIRTSMGRRRVATSTDVDLVSQYDPTPIEIVQTKDAQLLVYIPGYKEEPLLNYTDPSPLTINYISFSTFGATTARWWYDCGFDGFGQELEAVARPITVEQRLIAHLENTAQNKTFPAFLDSVKFSYQVRSVAYEQSTSTLKTRFHMIFYWEDARLAWNATEYNNITVLVRPSLEIWQPDIIVLNSAASTLDSLFTSPELKVYANGSVAMLANNVELNTWCVDSERNWPHERLHCEIKLGMNEIYNALGVSVLALESDRKRPLSNEPMNTLSEWTILTMSVAHLRSDTTTRFNDNTGIMQASNDVSIGFLLQRNNGFYRNVFIMPIYACQIFIILSFLLRGYRRGALILLVVVLTNMGLMFIAKHATTYYVPNLMLVYQHVLRIATFCYFLHIVVMWLELYPPKSEPWSFLKTLLQFNPLRLILCMQYGDASEYVSILEKPWHHLAKMCNNFCFIVINVGFLIINTHYLCE